MDSAAVKMGTTPDRWAATDGQQMNELLVVESGRRRYCRWVRRRVILYVRPGRPSRGSGMPTIRQTCVKVAD